MILIRDVRVVDPASGTDMTSDILICGDKITAVSPGIYDGVNEMMLEEAASECSDPGPLTLINAQGLVAAPGLVDTHVHFRDPGFTWKEDILSGAAAAARGGFTTVVCMANTDPPVDNPSTLRYVLEKGAGTGIHVLSASTLTAGMAGKELTDLETMARSGAVVFTDDGKCVTDEKLLLEGMKRAADLGIPVSLHEEDPLLVKAPGVNEGETARKIGYPGASERAEQVMTARDCILSMAAGARICIQHVSSAGTVSIIRLAKEMGADIHAEAAPHHFSLTEEAVLEYGTNARMNPPLRTEKDRLAIIEGLKDGTIDMIATDHAPHTAKEKSQPMAKAPSGVTGLETALGAGIEALVKPGHISLMKLLELMSTSPARFLGLVPGSICEGAAADIVLFDENEYRTVSAQDFVSRSTNSPFIGKRLPGQVKYTICAGKIVYRDENADLIEHKK